MKKLLPFFIFLLALGGESQAQFTRYLIRLKDKGGTPYTFSNPLEYLSQRAIDRRTNYGIALDSTDLPVTPSYITQIKNVPNVTLLNVSKWTNSVTIRTSDANAINTINSFSFVQSSSGIAAKFADPSSLEKQDSKIETEIIPVNNSNARTQQVTGNYFNYGPLSINEIHLHNGEFLHNIGLRGQGMQIAMLDNGFNNYTAPSYDAFDSINASNQVLGTWDFVAMEQNVTDDGNHGMSCFSTIAANIPGLFVGNAPKANFWLFQTEENGSENAIEEHNWACGAERADSSGADIISTSLGYTDFPQSPGLSHVYADMNGNTTMSAIAADLAAKKGMLVFASAGNSGTDSWHFLGSPADGDSVIAVGAVNTSGTVGNFSSYGPSSDGRIKPDVASVGVSSLIEAAGGSVSFGNGTSFAGPKMAGLGTCLWQGFPEFNNMKIVRAIQQAGSIAGSPNDRIGYGIPDMKKAFSSLLVDFATSDATNDACTVTINWTSKDVAAMKYEIERKAPGESVFTKVGEINPMPGSILANHSYQFNNMLVSVSVGTVSYRIRQIIDTATATFTAAYIDTANVASAGCFPTGTNDPNLNSDFISVQPNPTSGKTVKLIIETSYAVSNMPIAIYNINGALVMQLQKSKGSGKTSFDLPVQNFPKGKYIIKVYNKQKTIGSTSLLIL
ncbi:MAG: S8 family peptidase [Bacteroidia bacterium]|nr:S8 family peptidase [Bacteroidia bacterium]